MAQLYVSKHIWLKLVHYVNVKFDKEDALTCVDLLFVVVNLIISY